MIDEVADKVRSASPEIKNPVYRGVEIAPNIDAKEGLQLNQKQQSKNPSPLRLRRMNSPRKTVVIDTYQNSTTTNMLTSDNNNDRKRNIFQIYFKKEPLELKKQGNNSEVSESDLSDSNWDSMNNVLSKRGESSRRMLDSKKRSSNK